MSLGTQALLLIRLDARAGHFVTVDELAQHYGWPQDEVRRELSTLADSGYCGLEYTMGADGVPLITQAIVNPCEGQPCA